MRVFVQRVSSASVSVDGRTVGEIPRGLLLLVGFGRGDTPAMLAPMAHKILNLKIFSDDSGRFQHSVLDTGGALLAVPQFTLYADTRRGRRPEFTEALAPDPAATLFARFVDALRSAGAARVATGKFGAYMQVASCNDGPVSLLLERES